jgi:hypothetical protein
MLDPDIKRGILEGAVRRADNVAIAERLVSGSGALADPGADAAYSGDVHLTKPV